MESYNFPPMKRRAYSPRLLARDRENEFNEVFEESFLDNKGDFKAIAEDPRVKGYNKFKREVEEHHQKAFASFTEQFYEACGNGNLPQVQKLCHLWAADINGSSVSPTAIQTRVTPSGLTSTFRNHLRYHRSAQHEEKPKSTFFGIP